MTPTALLAAALVIGQSTPAPSSADLEVPAPAVVAPVQPPIAAPPAVAPPASSGSRFSSVPPLQPAIGRFSEVPPAGASVPVPSSPVEKSVQPAPPAAVSPPSVPKASLPAVRLGGVLPADVASPEPSSASEDLQHPKAGVVEKWLAEALNSTPSVDGNNVRIFDCLASVAGRTSRLGVVAAYWELSAMDIRHRWAKVDYQLVSQLMERASGADRVVLAAVEARAAAEVTAAKLALNVAQHDLVEVARLSSTKALPVPQDGFYVGPYGTNFETIFVGRIVPSPLRRIDGTLPQLRELMSIRATALETSQKTADLLVEGYAEAQVDLPPVLAGREQLRLAREEFISAVQRYNLDIAQFALGAAAETVSRGQVVGMLLPGKVPDEPVLVAPVSLAPLGVLQPASATQLVPVPAAQALPGVPESALAPMSSVLKQPKLVPATAPPTFVPVR
jgi:hypothetical protein